MTRVTGPLGLFIALLLVRGLGQSALSVVSIAAVGKWFRRRLGIAMGVYSLLLTVGFVGSILWMGAAVRDDGWRDAWATLGWVLLAVVPVSWLLQRNTPEELGQTLDAPATPEVHVGPRLSRFHVGASTPHARVLGLCARNGDFQSRLVGRDAVQPVGPGGARIQARSGRASDGRTHRDRSRFEPGRGAVVRRERLGILLGLGMATLTASLAALPSLRGNTGLWLYASAMGLTGGLVMVIFFAAWSHLFGRAHLGRIQGAAQLISVLASAAGPDLLAECQAKVAPTPRFSTRSPA